MPNPSFAGTTKANVAFIRNELTALLPQYYLIRDAISGETAVKAAKTKYLPMPDKSDQSPENKQRYEDYLTRAVFYNATRRTLAGLVGQVFMRDPVVTIPPQLEIVATNTSGTGVNLIQHSKKALTMTLAYSRCGLHVDYPNTGSGEDGEGVVTVADVAANRYRPTINLYSPLEIINWRTMEDGAEEKLCLVVLFETYVNADDGFETKTSGQFRVLKLDENGQYVQEIWREPQPTNSDGSKIPKGKNWQVAEVSRPRGPDGKPLTEIPFMFIGSENNDSAPDNPNFYDLASLNMAHYRNSADYEESCFIVGQPTPVATGLTEDWVKDVLKGTLRFGSRGGILLPQGATAELLQASENTMIKEAMEAKERQMVALGAKLVEQKSVQRTAFETKVEATSEGSTLSSTAKNVSAAYKWALEICAMFANADAASVEFELNTEFDLARMTPEEQKAAVENWQKGAVTFEEMRDVLRKAGTATVDDKKAKEAIANEQAEALKQTAAAMDAAGMNDPNGNNGNNNNDPSGGSNGNA